MEDYIVYMELLSGHEKIITKSGISLNAGTLNGGFTEPVSVGYNINHMWDLKLTHPTFSIQ
jgi:hypothetical protein